MGVESGPVLVLGAGATKACDGPLTNEILWEADQSHSIIEREDYLYLLDEFLQVVFRMPARGMRSKWSYPGLPLLMSLVDASIDRLQPLHKEFPVPKLRKVREALEFTIFAVLEFKLRSAVPDHHDRALNELFPPGVEPRVISLNYDIVADNVMARRNDSMFPDYCCDVQTETYRMWGKWGKLLKPHGSLNWLYCPNCNRLDVAVSRGGRFSKALEQLYMTEGGDANDLDARYTCHGSPCRNCGTFVRPVMITPTQKKDYRNPHIAQVWYKAEEVLRSATAVVFVGYSMPADDVEVVYLLKRGLEHLPAQEITVVEFDKQNRGVTEHEVGQRYQSVFGEGVQWHTCGFAGWLDERAKGIGACGGA